MAVKGRRLGNVGRVVGSPLARVRTAQLFLGFGFSRVGIRGNLVVMENAMAYRKKL